MALSPDEHQAVEAAFNAAQARTRAPIACVLASASSDYAIMPMFWSGLATLATPWPLLLFTALSAERIFIAQLVVCLVSLAVLSWGPLRVALTPSRARRAQAHRAALVQYSLRGLDRAAEQNGVLLYVSLTERYARVIAHPGASRVISAGQWQGLIDVLTADLGGRGLAEALRGAAVRCADLLEIEYPADRSAHAPEGHRFHAI
jgi:putative membrane protein